LCALILVSVNHQKEEKMDQKIKDFVALKRVAVVGVSRNEQKMGNAIYTELKENGYEVYGVNPQLSEIKGDKCFASISDLAGKVNGALIAVSPKASAQVIRDAVAAGITKIWLNQGSQSVEASKVSRELGVSPIEGKCIFMYAGGVKSVHGFHRFIAKLIGQY
jgi:predicted CoA-binding protein